MSFGLIEEFWIAEQDKLLFGWAFWAEVVRGTVLKLLKEESNYILFSGMSMSLATTGNAILH